MTKALKSSGKMLGPDFAELCLVTGIPTIPPNHFRQAKYICGPFLLLLLGLFTIVSLP